MAEERPFSEHEEKSTENEKQEPSISNSSSEQHDDDDQTVYPTGKALALIMLALYLAVFLVALVRPSPGPPLEAHTRGK